MLGDPRVERRPVGLEVSGQGGMVRVSGGWRGRRGQITGVAGCAEGVHHGPAQFAPVGLSGSLAIKWAWLLLLARPFLSQGCGEDQGRLGDVRMLPKFRTLFIREGPSSGAESGPRPAASASAGTCYECIFSGPALTLPHSSGGGAQKSVFSQGLQVVVMHTQV